MGLISAICFIWIGVQLGAPVAYYVAVACAFTFRLVSEVIRAFVKYYDKES